MISFSSKGGWENTEKWMKKVLDNDFSDLEEYGQMGVDALSSATPVDSGVTSESWSYEIRRDDRLSLIHI